MSTGSSAGPMRSFLIVVVVALLLGFASGCTSSNSSNSSSSPSSSGSQTSAAQTTHFAKTKFVFHAGLAFGAIHRYIYKPYKQGELSGGLFHHKLATLKAALAAAFAYHEIRLALNDARSSRILSALLSPILALQTKLSSLRASLEHGSVNPAAIDSTNTDTQKIGAQSSARGQPIQDQPTPALGG